MGQRRFRMDGLLDDLGRLWGVEPPAVKLPLALGYVLANAAERAPGRPVVTVEEVRAASLWWAFRSNKAKRELGWTPSHHEDTLESTIAWYREREGNTLASPGPPQPLIL